MEVCPECDGVGELTLVSQTAKQSCRETLVCPLCRGSGALVAEPRPTTPNVEPPKQVDPEPQL